MIETTQIKLCDEWAVPEGPRQLPTHAWDRPEGWTQIGLLSGKLASGIFSLEELE